MKNREWSDSVTQYDGLAELLARLVERLQVDGIHTAQAHHWATQAAEWLDIAIEGYEARHTLEALEAVGAGAVGCGIDAVK